MKNYILLLVFVFSFSALAEVSIISDLDDTIKITNVPNPVAAGINGIFKRNVFSGMPEFLKEAKSYSEKLHILTASPHIVAKSAMRTLKSNGIAYDSIAFKNPLKAEDKIHYKMRKIKAILNDSSHDFILIGDDVDKDPEVFEKILVLYPNRILASYIHVVRHRTIPEGMISYITPGDLALRELVAGRMGVDSAKRVFDKLLHEDRTGMIIPGFAYCPSSKAPWLWQLETVLFQRASQLMDILVRHCSGGSKS